MKRTRSLNNFIAHNESNKVSQQRFRLRSNMCNYTSESHISDDNCSTMMTTYPPVSINVSYIKRTQCSGSLNSLQELDDNGNDNGCNNNNSNNINNSSNNNNPISYSSALSESDLMTMGQSPNSPVFVRNDGSKNKTCNNLCDGNNSYDSSALSEDVMIEKTLLF